MAQHGRRSANPHADDLSQALRSVLTLGALSRVKIARALGMSTHDVEAIEHVMLAAAAGEPIGPVELSRRVGVTSAAATQSVHRLVGAGHLERSPHPSDRRRRILSVTDDGAARVLAELLPLFRLIAEAGADLSEAERAGARAYLDRVADACRLFLADPGPSSPAPVDAPGPSRGSARARPADRNAPRRPGAGGGGIPDA